MYECHVNFFPDQVGIREPSFHLWKLLFAQQLQTRGQHEVVKCITTVLCNEQSEKAHSY